MSQQMDVKGILNDPKFYELPETERVKVLNSVDPDNFGLLPADQQMIVVRRGLPGSGAETISGPMTPMQTISAIIKSTARQMPTALGTVLGGLGGASAGAAAGPPGSFLGASGGAGLGAAAGEGLLGLLQNAPSPIGTDRSSLFGQPPKSPAEAFKNMASQGSMAAVGEGLGQGVTNVIPTLFQRNLSPEKLRRLNILEREGIPYTDADIHPSGPGAILENLTKGTLMGSSVINDSDVVQATKLFQFRKRVEDSLGPLMSKEELGNELKNAVESKSASLFGENGFFAKIYSRFDKLYNLPVNTKQIRSEALTIQGEIKELIKEGRLPSVNSKEAPSRFKALVDDLTKYGTELIPPTPPSSSPIFGTIPGQPAQRIEIPTTFKDVWKTRQLIEGTIRGMGADDPLKTQAKGVLERLDKILNTALDDAAKANPQALKQWRTSNELYKSAKQLYQTQSLVSDIENMDAEKLASRYFGPDQITPTRDLLSAISAGDRKRLLPAIQRRKVQDLFDALSKEFEEVPTISGKQLSERLKKHVDSFEILFKNEPEKLQAIQDFVDASKLSQNSGTMVNPASGRQMLAAQQVGSALQFAGTGLSLVQGTGVGSHLLMEGTTFFGPRVLAKMLTNPNVARLLAKGFTLSPATASKTGWTAKVLALLPMYQDKADQSKEDAMQ